MIDNIIIENFTQKDVKTSDTLRGPTGTRRWLNINTECRNWLRNTKKRADCETKLFAYKNEIKRATKAVVFDLFTLEVASFTA